MDGDRLRCGDPIFRELSGREPPLAKITAVTTGKIVDMDFHDSMNMGAAMAMAALDTIVRNFRDLGVDETHYDQIITGDLGTVGRRLLLDYLMQAGYRIESRYMDCRIEMFSPEEQDTHAGGSGCGCSAAVLCGYIPAEDPERGVEAGAVSAYGSAAFDGEF